ncbi:MAG: cell envelope integrity protein CreD [Bacteroidota bacterium]
MSDSPSFFERFNTWLRNSVTMRIVTIGILILLFMIPISSIESLIREREYRQQDTIQEVSALWGNPQTIKGPVLTIPYRTFSRVYDQEDKEKFRLVEQTEYAHFLPEKLLVNGQLLPEVRYRGIYEVIVYSSEIELKGEFPTPDFSEWNIDPGDIHWDDAYLALGLSDLRSIQEYVEVNWDTATFSFNPGVESRDIIQSGIHAALSMSPPEADKRKHSFALSLNFNGSSSLDFVPLGKSTEVSISSPWKDPSFGGAFLPDNREVKESGFSAQWEILHLNRPYPQSFRGTQQGIDGSAFGVSLLLPVDEYQKSMRSAKYALMLVSLTFMIFFFIQILRKVRIHPIQYIMVGLALVVFYTLLIALSEHISFQRAYLVASVAIITMITLYVHSIFKNTQLTLIMGGILVILYAFIYTIIQLQDFALLMGSVGLFIVLAIVMYLSRKIDWYNT